MTGRELQLGVRPPPVKMEDQVLYTNVVFNMCDNAKPKDVVKTEEVVYSEVKPKLESTSPSTTTLIEEVVTQKSTPFRWITAGLGLLTVLLLAGVIAMCVLNVTQVSKYRNILALYSNESTANMKLRADLASLESEKQDLTVQRNQFNSTLQSIIRFRDFPVESYCTSTDGGE
ncbi:uncharacterized protein LOC134310050 [Trichomycterus rosablanca]|uniref:uncharacterized protein LOC134310050 n=1 Tax=Trichomycterus rosablanca TaxID=2290929 RepID=UPI002F354BC4